MSRARPRDRYAVAFGVMAPALDRQRDRDRAVARGLTLLLPRVVAALGREAARLDEDERAAMTFLEGLACAGNASTPAPRGRSA